MAKRGWNTVDLAREAGISNQTVGRFLRGVVQTPKTAAKLAAALGQDVERYLTRVEVPGKPPGSQGSPTKPILPFQAAAVTR
ncbi:MAG TPA: helix-turn-helix domain-containing protein [Vicinamibacterales bacterium]|nr:helix-turn-helix domain-containing protein [Vicinamibacterales bacterium]